MKFLKKIGKFLLGLAVVAAVIVAAVFYFTGDAVKVVQNQLKALRNSDVTAAYTYTSKDFQAATTEKQFETFVKANPILTTNKSASFPSREIFAGLNTTSTLDGELKAQDDSTTAITYQMIKEDGSWMILSMEVAQADTVTTDTPASSDLTETFSETGFAYTLKYPESWIPAIPQAGQALFSPSDEISAPTVNIRTYAYDDAGTLFTDLRDYISSSASYGEVKFTGEKTYTHTAKNGTQLKGKEVTITYDYDSIPMTERMIVIPGVVSGESYAWEYFASTQEYAGGKSAADAMLESWSI